MAGEEMSRHKGISSLSAVAFLIGAFILQVKPAGAWGLEGHQVIADIAQNHLTAMARERIVALLQSDGASSMADVAGWADEYRFTHKATESWHYVDIPVGAPTYDQQRDCPTGHCVVAIINEMVSILSSPNADLAEQVTALKFLVHFVGDVEMPLHVANDNDHGGNMVKVTIGRREYNLHHVWDTEIIVRGGGKDSAALAAALDGQISTKDITDWMRSSTPEEWANEAHQIAVNIVYGFLPPASMNGAIPLDGPYLAAAVPVAMRQLQIAGVRLAGLLNAVYR